MVTPERRDLMRRDIESGAGTFTIPDMLGQPHVVVTLDAHEFLELLDRIDELEGRR